MLLIIIFITLRVDASGDGAASKKKTLIRPGRKQSKIFGLSWGEGGGEVGRSNKVYMCLADLVLLRILAGRRRQNEID